MKIGILTFHRSINNGAFIQCYSLSNKLKELFPSDLIEVIDYQMPVIDSLYDPSAKCYFRGDTLHKVKCLFNVVKNPGFFKHKRERFDAFRSVLPTLNLSENITDNGTKELFETINNEYDIVVAGSDAIWNYTHRGYPNPYYLSDEIKIPKLSYAASCYGMSFEKIPAKQKEEIKRILDTYQFLGVRDEESNAFLKYINCTNSGVHTCDPTVFLDIDSLPIDHDILADKLKKRGFKFDIPTIAVMGTDEMCSFVSRLYGKKYQIVALYNYCSHANVNLHDLTPFEWAYVFRYFKLTFTTYFHGTLLSLRNGTPTISIALETEYSTKHITKVEDVLTRLDLHENYFHTDFKEGVDNIKARADYLLSNDLKSKILKKMDIESETIVPFIEKLQSLRK